MLQKIKSLCDTSVFDNGRLWPYPLPLGDLAKNFWPPAGWSRAVPALVGAAQHASEYPGGQGYTQCMVGAGLLRGVPLMALGNGYPGVYTPEVPSP